MTVYLISNNLLSNNISYDMYLDIEKKKEYRPLSSEGVKQSIKLNLKEVDKIYSSSYVSCIESAKYLAEKKDLNITITSELNDCKVGDLKNQSIKTLAYFQEHDFDFKQPGGESLNECGSRINLFVRKYAKEERSYAIFLPRRALMSFLIKYTSHEFNLDDRLILINEEEIVLDSIENDIDLFKLIIENGNIEIVKL